MGPRALDLGPWRWDPSQFCLVWGQQRALVRQPCPQVLDEGPRLRRCFLIYKEKAIRTSRVLTGIKQ